MRRKNEYKTVNVYMLTNINTGEKIKGYGRTHASRLVGMGVSQFARTLESKQAHRGWFIEDTGTRERVKVSEISSPSTKCQVVNRNHNLVEYTNTLENCAEYMDVHLYEASNMIMKTYRHRTYDLKVVE